jgi:hypothetical protein
MPEPDGRGVPTADILTESRRLVAAATGAGVTVRLLGGVAVCLQAPASGPLLPRPIGDIDLVTPRESRRATVEVLTQAGYTADEMFNALHGARRMVFYDEVNHRKLDVFVGEFSMCHAIPIAERLERDPLTIPLAELMLTKLQIVELNERDQRDLYNLAYHHAITQGDSSGIEADLIGELCARDWGLWRTTGRTIERCLADLDSYQLPAEASELISARLRELWDRVEAVPKSGRWKLRSRVGERVRWYAEPEENAAQA